MKQYFIFLIGVLLLMGQRWIPDELASFNSRFGKIPYNLVFIIGEEYEVCDYEGIDPFIEIKTNCYLKTRELFEVPVPESETKWMSPEEADSLNIDLLKLKARPRN